MGDLLAPGASASPCWLLPAKAPSSYSYLGFSFCESPNPSCREGGGSSCQAARQTVVWAPFLPLHQRGVRKGLSPVTPLSPVFWNRTWRTTRMEPRPLQSRMGESVPGQGQVGTHPVLLAPGFWLPSPGPCSVVHLTSLSYLTSCPKETPAWGPCPAHYPSASLTRPPPPGSLSCRNPQPLNSSSLRASFSVPSPAGTPGPVSAPPPTTSS